MSDRNEKAAKRATFEGRVHLVLAVMWLLLLIPTILWWKNSILWVLSVSLYANIVSHISAYQGTKAEKMSAENP